jgi:hypothetical protein
MNRFPVVSFTDAPWPSWAQTRPYSKTKPYSEGYLDRYEGKSIHPGKIEKFFASRLGDVIPDRYIADVGGFLNDINKAIKKTRGGSSHPIQCSILFIESIVCVPEERSVIVHNIFIRPCVWGLGFFQLTLLQLIISSLYMGMSLWILNPTDEMILELKRISSKFHDDKDKEKDDDGNVLKFMILDKKDMGNAVREIVSKNHLAKGHKNGVVVLNENYKFPSFNDLNNPKWVNNKNNHIIH